MFLLSAKTQNPTFVDILNCSGVVIFVFIDAAFTP